MMRGIRSLAALYIHKCALYYKYHWFIYQHPGDLHVVNSFCRQNSQYWLKLSKGDPAVLYRRLSEVELWLNNGNHRLVINTQQFIPMRAFVVCDFSSLIGIEHGTALI